MKQFLYWINPTFNFNFYADTNSEYITFLTTISAIGGVFIALYFSSISVINATLYSQFPNNIRELLTTEKYGNTYIRFLSFSTFFAFTLIVFYIIGYDKIYIAQPIMLILVGITIFSYVNLGIYTFNLFDPSTLSKSIFDNLYKTINNATDNSPYHKDKSFQQHYFTKAKYQIDTLTTLLSTTSTNFKLHGKSLNYLLDNIFILLSYYQQQKRNIPNDSLWYQQTYHYKDLYQSDETTINVSLQSATMPDAKIENNKFWIEDKLIPYIIKILILNIKEQNKDETKNILDSISQYLSLLVQLGHINYSIKIINNIKTEFKTIKLNDDSDFLEITKYIYSLPLSIVLNFYHNIDVYSYRYIENIIDNNNLTDKNIQLKFQEDNLFQLDWLSKKLKLEYKMENQYITPKWYQIEILMLNVSKNFIVNLEKIQLLIKEFFDDDFMQSSDLQLYAIVLTQQWETINKYNYQFHKIEAILNDYTKAKRIDGLDWKSFSLKDIISTNNSIKEECILKIGKSIVTTGKRNDDNYPDIFGYFIHLTSNNLLDLAIKNSLKDFISIYQAFFIGSIQKYKELRPLIADITNFDWRKENEFIVAFSPIMNLMEITGQIKILLDFHLNETMWNEIESIWIKDFNTEQSYLKIKLFVTAISMSERKFGIPLGSMQRHNWENKVKDFLEQNIKRDTYTKSSARQFSYFRTENIVLHNNPLVRVYIGSKRHRSNFDGIDIFINEFFNKNYKDKKLNFGSKRDMFSIKKYIESDIEIYNEYIKYDK
jgi:hypothetical protein